jgi:dipeptidyl aminopeptidase/acylaminoacyl peptidase
MNRLIGVILVLVVARGGVQGQGTQADYDRSAALGAKYSGKLLRSRVEPVWNEAGTEFWYRVEVRPGKQEIVHVDIVKGTKKVVPEMPKLPPRKNAPAEVEEFVQQRRGGQSPDGKFRAFIKENNVWLRDQSRNMEFALSTDGKADDAYGRIFWSPDSQKLVAIRTKAGGDRRVTLVESSPKDQLQPKTSSYFYLKPGDAIPLARPMLFDIAQKQAVPVDNALFNNPWDISYEHWSADSQVFYFAYNQRGHTVMRVLAINAKTGKVEPIVNEECKTFFDYANKLYLQYLDDTQELIWMSERDGWNHLYLIDLKTGKVKNPITQGNWVVRKVENVNVAERTIRFQVMGLNPQEDPYHVHMCRIKFDGTGLVKLTEGDGTHTLTYSPKGDYYIDGYSRVDLPPVHELRRTSDGKKVLDLEKADDSELKKLGWRAPERFVAKGRDGTTDIHGMIVRPSNFDPKKKYPVIEYIYAGPHGFFTPKRFSSFHYQHQRMAELGFIVVQMDGMGTNWRSKAFHDVCWKNLGDAGFPDRMAWIKSAAAKYPQMDLSRGVGIFGGSAGGQSSTRALLAHPEFYTVAVSDCGCHDNRVDKIWWNELWMSWPIGPHYAEQSNTNPKMVRQLKGKLMLVVGELDKNVDPASTLQVANALIQADKDFDLLVIPGAGHGACETPYGQRRRMDFFVRHLLGVEPRR